MRRNPVRAAVRELCDLAEGARFRFVNDADLCDGLARVFAGAGFAVERDIELSARDRAELMVGRVAVLVRVAGDAKAVAAAVCRCAEGRGVDSVLLVTTRLDHSSAAPHRAGVKPVYVVCLGWRGQRDPSPTHRERTLA